MTTLVTGSSGQVGTAFRELLPDASYPTRSELDLSHPGAVATWLGEVAPERIINCAAYTAVDKAEEDEATAFVINAESVEVMAAYAAAADIPFTTFSTDYVFDGTAHRPYLESDATNPINAYGRTKLAGETRALDAYPACLVVRTSWIISGTHPNFVATMLRLVRTRELRVVDDQRGCPTVASDLAAATLAAMEAGVTGILHLTNRGPTTWYGLARTAVELAGADPDRIAPCSSDEYQTRAARPANSVLGSERRAPIALELPHWVDSLPSVVAGLVVSQVIDRP